MSLDQILYDGGVLVPTWDKLSEVPQGVPVYSADEDNGNGCPWWGDPGGGSDNKPGKDTFGEPPYRLAVEYISEGLD